MNQLCLGKNLLSEKLADGGIDAVTPSNIMKPENEIRLACIVRRDLRGGRNSR
jgi:hypothetical protein